MKEKGRIINQGMGGFLCPPGHPMRSKSVETDLRRRPENRGGMSLEAAADCDYLDAATVQEARRLLADWRADRPPLDSPDVQEWILQVLGYFRGCYNLDDPDVPENWHAANLTIKSDAPPMVYANQHAGVRLIRRYYPEYTPSEEHFARAYWGQKPKEKGQP